MSLQPPPSLRIAADRAPRHTEVSGRPTLRLPALLAGTGLLVWAFTAAAFRDAEGFLTAEACLPIALAVGVSLVGAGVGTPLASATRWLALAVQGQAVALALVQAGPTVSYQHYASAAGMAERPGLMLALAVQAGLVTLGGRRLWPRARTWLRRRWNAPQLLGMGAVLVASSAALSREPGTYVLELALASLVQLLTLATVALAVTSVPADVLARVGAGLDRVAGPERRVGAVTFDRFSIATALLVTIVSAALSIFAYDRHPHVPDEVSYLLHAGYFSRGLLALPVPPVPHGFDVDLMMQGPRGWFSPFPPGWPAMLSVGVLLGVPWLVNPVLAGVNIVLSYRLIGELYDRRIARTTAVLLALSPWHLFLGMSFMAHVFTLTCVLVAAIAVVRMRRSGRSGWGWLGGAALGVVSLIRPLDGFAMALLLGCCALPIRGRHFRLLPVLTLTAGAAAVGALNVPYNQILTGSAGKFPVMDYFDRLYGPGVNDLGFGADRGVGWTGLDPFHGHGWVDVLINASLNAFATNIELFGWGTGSLFLLLGLVFSRRMIVADLLMLAAIAMVVGLQSLYWFSGGPDFGARYWFLTILPCVVLTARAIEELSRSPGGMASLGRGRDARGLLAALVLSLAAFVSFVPWRAIDKYHHYRGMRAEVRSMAADPIFSGGLLLISGKRHPDYASAAVYNPVDPRSPAPVFAWDRDPGTRAELLRAFPDRQVWIVNGPTRSGAGYRVVTGPRQAADFLRANRQ